MFHNLDDDNIKLVVIVDSALFVAHLVVRVTLQALHSSNIHYLLHVRARDNAYIKMMNQSFNHSILVQSLMMMGLTLNCNIVF